MQSDVESALLRQTLALLPTAKLPTVPPEGKGLHGTMSIRFGQHQGYSYLIAINNASWSETVRLEWNQLPLHPVEWLSDFEKIGINRQQSEVPSLLMLPLSHSRLSELPDEQIQLRQWKRVAPLKRHNS